MSARIRNRFSRSWLRVAAPRAWVLPIEAWNPNYVRYVSRVPKSQKKLSNFRRNSRFTHVLADVPRHYVEEYVAYLRKEYPDLASRMPEVAFVDQVGNPATFDVDGHQLSGNLIRYQKVTGDLRKLFGPSIPGRIVEIGVGFGGQFLVADHFLSFEDYVMVDLLPVLHLAEAVCEQFLVHNSYRCITCNQLPETERYDLVISNYAFSELPRSLQLRYLERVLCRSRRGYITMNAGTSDLPSEAGPMTIGDIVKKIPEATVIRDRESVDTSIVVWGNVGEIRGIEQVVGR